MIELYLRAMKGDFSNSSRLALKAFFDTLPGFNMAKALKGDAQDGKASEQYGFLSMQLTKPLGSLADDYGHIFRTPLGEVDIDDVVLNRRILIVLLPALQKAPEEMQMCGKIVVNLVKIMMGNASGSALHGSKQEIVDSKQTRAPSPYIVVLDEAGYYMVKGIDVMMAQARALGFMIIVAGQDISAMQAISPQIAESAAANASIFAAGKTVDGDKTVGFIQKLFGRTQVSVTSGYTAQSGAMGTKWVDRMDASFQEVDKVKLEELQNMQPGEFYLLFDGTLVRASTFFVGTVGKDGFGDNYSVNKFLKVRGPTDRVPGLDQTVEINFIKSMVDTSEKLLRFTRDAAGLDGLTAPEDAVSEVSRVAQALLWRAAEQAGRPRSIHHAWLGGLMHGTDVAEQEYEDDAGDDAESWEDELNADLMGELGIDGEIQGERPVGEKHPMAPSMADLDIDDATGEDEPIGDVVSGLQRAARGPHAPGAAWRHD